MQKIVVVQGKKNSGKTSAIHEAAKLLGCGLTANSPADIFMVTRLKIGKVKYNVGIASAGDDAPTIKKNIDAFYPHHLDYIITACSAPRVGLSMLQGFAALERTALVIIPCARTPSATKLQIGAKVSAIAKLIRNELP